MRKGNVWIAGMAIFAMFFGSGNLVFPIALGQAAEGGSWMAGFGLMLTAIVVPFLGVVTMILFGGSQDRFFRWLGRVPQLIICGAIIALIGPFGVLPRCLTISYASFAHYLPGIPLVVFSLGACALIYWILVRKGRFVNVIGYLLTPPLLISLGLIVVLGFLGDGGSAVAATETPFWDGLVSGYQTLDLLAAIFFATTVVRYCDGVKMALKAGAIGLGLLAVTYFGFIFLGAHYGLLLEGVAPQQLLLVLAHHVLGPWGGLVASVAIGLACLTTAIALANVSAQFLGGKRWALPAVLAISVIISTFDFGGIAAYLGPILFYMYPLVILITLVNLVLETHRQRKIGAGQRHIVTSDELVG